MIGRDERRKRTGEGGFTVIELLVYLVIALVLMTAIYNLLIGQNRLYMKQRELQDVRTSVRAAANLLAFEFRQASASAGDLDSISTYDIVLRSLQGSGVVCAMHDSVPRLGLYATGGDFEATAEDSAMVFEANGSGTEDDTWFIAAVTNVWGSPSSGGVPHCGWSGVSEDPEFVVQLDTTRAALAGVDLGAPYRQYRRIHYGLYVDTDGRWWLGRKVGAATDWEKLTGPLSEPSDSGLAFRYYDQSGGTTADPTLVRMVDIILRGESYGKAPQGGDLAPAVEEDTLTLRVSLRG